MQTKKVLIGFLLLGALVIFALSTFYIENWHFYVQEGYRISARFERALELSSGDEVRIAGVDVGRVHNISVEPHKELPVKVSMWIRKDVDVREQDIAVIRMRSIFGGSFLEIERVDSTVAQLEEGGTIALTRVSNSIPEIIEKSDLVLEEALGAVDDSRQALNNIALISERLERGEGTIGKLLRDDSAYYELTAALEGAGNTLEGLSRVTESVQKGHGILGRLISDEDWAERFADTVDGSGKFAKMLGELADDFPESSLGRLASDDEMYVKLESTLHELESAIIEVSRGEGTMGRLISDPELYDKVNATVDGVQQIINEYREQSPILTFTGAVFGAM